MITWLLSFFSSEAYIKNLVNQMTTATKCISKVKDKLVRESAELEYNYQESRKAIDTRFSMTERVGATLASFAPHEESSKNKSSKN